MPNDLSTFAPSPKPCNAADNLSGTGKGLPEYKDCYRFAGTPSLLLSALIYRSAREKITIKPFFINNIGMLPSAGFYPKSVQNAESSQNFYRHFVNIAIVSAQTARLEIENIGLRILCDCKAI